MAVGSGDTSRDASHGPYARHLVHAGVVGAANRERLGFGEMVEAESNPAVLADADSGDGVVHLCALVAVQGNTPPQSPCGLIVDRRSTITQLAPGGIRTGA